MIRFVILFLAMLMSGYLTCRGAGGAVAAAPATVGAWPVLSLAATVLPLGEVTEAVMGSWIMVLFAVAAGIGSLAGVAALFRPAPALHKQFADREDHDRDIREIKESLKAMRGEFETWSSAHYEARRRMHRKIGHLSTAMAFLAGTLEKTEPQIAARLRVMIDKADEEDSDE